MIVISVGIVLSLILLNALYVAAEFAAVGVRVSRVKSLADRGHRLATILLPILDDRRRLDDYIAACQIGITVSSLILGAYGQVAFAQHIATGFTGLFTIGPVAALTLATLTTLVSLTVLQVVFGELIPKSLALQFPTRTALFTVIPMRWSVFAFSFLISLLNGSGNFLLRTFGFSASHHHHIHSPEEIGMIISESRTGGLLEAHAQERLHNALQLQFKTAQHLMIHRKNIAAINVEDPAALILQTVVASPYTRMPVFQGGIDNVVGILRTKDLVKRYSKSGNINNISELLSPPTFIPETLSADRVLTMLREQRRHQGIVVDEHSSVVGLITLEDVLSEIFGTVVDEFKSKSIPLVERLDDGSIRVEGDMRLDQISEALSVKWKGNSNTIGGFLVERLGRFPQEGEVINLDEHAILIEKLKNHMEMTLVISPSSGSAVAQGEA